MAKNFEVLIDWNDGEQDRALVTELSLDIPVSVAWKHDESWTGVIQTIIDCFDVAVLRENNETTNIVSIRELLFLNPERFINAEAAWREDPTFKGTISRVFATKKKLVRGREANRKKPVLQDMTDSENVQDLSGMSSTPSITSTPKAYQKNSERKWQRRFKWSRSSDFRGRDR